jgi:hypothetical protein
MVGELIDLISGISWGGEAEQARDLLIDEPEHVAKRRGRGCVREPVRAKGVVRSGEGRPVRKGYEIVPEAEEIAWRRKSESSSNHIRRVG